MTVLPETRDWLALISIDGIGPVSFHRLVKKFGTPGGVLAADPGGLAEAGGISSETAGKICKFEGWKEIDRQISTCDTKKIDIICFSDSRYPALLKEITDPPPLIFSKGDLGAARSTAVAIVGSRYPSDYGQKTARDLAGSLAGIGCTVVSGFARGIDSMAHRGALEAGGRTIGVLGCGVDRIYPPENVKLYSEVIENGAIISEFPAGTPPDPGNFPRRNRIISGMSHGVVVVEASLNSGSLITAKWALEQGREVFAVPGNVVSYRSKGTNKLIKDGARLVETFSDILEELGPKIGRDVADKLKISVGKAGGGDRPDFAGLDENERKVMTFLSDDSLHMDEILTMSGFAIGTLSSLLVGLELKGLIVQAGGRYSRKQ